MTDQSISELRDQADARRDAIARDVELVTDRVDPNRIADRQKARLSQRVSSVRDTVFGTSDTNRSVPDDEESNPSITDRAGEKVQQAKDAAPDSVAGFTEGNPIAAGLIGVGVGLLAATLIPSTREERQAASKAQDSINSAATQLAQSGQTAAEAIKPAAQDAADEVKSSAQGSVEAVKGDARSAADDVKGEAKERADDVRSDG